MEALIEVSGISFDYEGHPVLRDVSFALHRGDFAGVIGPNGSGKSTLLKLLLRALKPAGGSIRLFGTPVEEFRQWARIGYAAQKIPYHSALPASAFEVVSSNLYAATGFLHRPSKAQREKVYEALKATDMLPYAKTPIHELSGGQQQRIHIARILVNDPEILMLDEPSAGMDAPSECAMYELLRKLNRERSVTVLMVTHDITAVTAYANRLLCMGGYGIKEHAVGDNLDEDTISTLYGRDMCVHIHT